MLTLYNNYLLYCYENTTPKFWARAHEAVIWKFATFKYQAANPDDEF